MRSSYFDNLKIFLIFLVVFGHSIEKLKSTFGIEYDVIYSFHIPLFVMVSGYFSSLLKTDKDYWKLTQVLLIPYIFLEIFYGITDSLLHGKNMLVTLSAPNWGMWYLLSLFFWRLLLNVVDQYQHTLIILIIFALLIGYDNSIGNSLSLSRTIVFFPFFYLGYVLSQSKLDISKLSHFRYIGFFILVSFILLWDLIDLSISYKWFYGTFSYMKLDEPIFGIFYRLVLYLLALIIGLSFLMIIPKRKLFFTHRGENTMNVYVWHFILLDLLTSVGFYNINKEFLTNNYILMLVFFILLSIFIVFILSSKFVDKYFSLHKISIIKLFKKVE